MSAVEEVGNGWVAFRMDVRIPLDQAPAFAAALTGNDDDIVLAAETAMRERIDSDDPYDAVELSIVSEHVVKPFLAEVMGPRS